MESEIALPLSILRCPETGQYLKPVEKGLATLDGKRHYPIIGGVPCLFLGNAIPTHSGGSALMRENAEVAAAWADGTLGDIALEQFVSNMLVPTCGNLFQGVAITDDFPLAPLPPSLPTGRILDIGCNWGRWSIGGSKDARAVVGVDPHLKALLCAKRLSERITPPTNRPQFVACDARNLPFARESFDGAFSYSVLQHFNRKNMEAILAEVSRVLRPGGVSEIQMPNKNGIKAMIDRLTFRSPSDEEFNVRYYSISDLVRTFADHIGPSTYRVDCFLGWNVHARDMRFVRGWKKAVVHFSSAAEHVATRFPPAQRMADSVFIRSEKPHFA